MTLFLSTVTKDNKLVKGSDMANVLSWRMKRIRENLRLSSVAASGPTGGALRCFPNFLTFGFKITPILQLT